MIEPTPFAEDLTTQLLAGGHPANFRTKRTGSDDSKR
jgi:hypothetical protein